MPPRAPLFQKVLLASLVLLALTARILPGPRTIDDSFITFRYARNILAGNSFVYNPGERVLGTTTPLYTLLLTSVGLVSGGPEAPFPQIAMILNALADAGTCLLLVHLGLRLGARWAGWGAGFAWAVAPYSVTFAIGGLETSLYVFLLIACVAAYLDNRRVLASLLAALSLLTRPDALLLILPLALDRLRQALGIRLELPIKMRKDAKLSAPLHKEPLTAAELLALFLPALAWFGFAALYFGSPIPHSIAAKSLAYRLPPEAAIVRLLQHYSTPFLEQLTFGTAGIMAGFVLYPFLFLLGVSQAIRRKPESWPWFAFPWLYFAAFAIANPLIFRWYLTPPLPAYILGILIGMETLLGSLLNRTKEDEPSHHPSRVYVGVLLVILIPVSLNLRGWVMHPDHGLSRPAPDMAWYQLELLYRHAADRVTVEVDGMNAPMLAAGDVGVLGYYTPTRILDTVGLNSAQSLKYYPLDDSYYTINYAVPPDLILDEQPDFIVILEVYGRKGLLRDSRFLDQYRLLEKIPTNIYDSDGILIFKKALLP